MIRRSVICAIFLSGSLLLAAGPLATVTAGPGLKINGKLIPNTGAPNWPVAIGDELATGAEQAVLTFDDGARVTLRPNTRILLHQCDHCIVQLFEGALDFKKPAQSRFEACAFGHQIRPAAATEGSITAEAPDKVVLKIGTDEKIIASGRCPCDIGGAPLASTGMSATKKAVIIAAAGGGAAAATIAVTRPDRKSKKER